MAQRGRKGDEELLEVHVTEEQLELLRKLNFPGTDKNLAKKPVLREEGLFLQMSKLDLENFVRWVAGEANHERKKRRAEMLHDIADEMELALGKGPLMRFF